MKKAKKNKTFQNFINVAALVWSGLNGNFYFIIDLECLVSKICETFSLEI